MHETDYDAVLLDLAPSLDVLHLNGLIAADWVVIPTRPDALAVDGVKEILTTMAEIARSGHRYRGYSILPTFFDRTTRETFPAVSGAGENIWRTCLAAHPAGYARARDCCLWQDSMGLRPALHFD